MVSDVPLRDVQEAASDADPRTTMRYDRAGASLDRHATYIVAAYVAGAARSPCTARRTAWPARPSQAAGARPSVTAATIGHARGRSAGPGRAGMLRA